MIKLNDTIIIPEYFPDKTLKLAINSFGENNTIIWHYENNEEQIIVSYIVKHIRSFYKHANINLSLPYVPNARMDRINNYNEVFTLKYFCEFINDLQFNKVFVYDVHSNVSLALIDNIQRMDISDSINYALKDSNATLAFYPDEGAYKRYSSMVKFKSIFGIKNRIKFNK